MNFILHHSDSDGFGAGFAAWLKFKDTESLYTPVGNGEPFPIPLDKLTKQDSVYILDVSYPLPVMQEILRVTEGRLTLIDHHKSARDKIGEQPWYIYDVNKSGCVLAWEYFHPDKEIPKILLHVQDWDLWRFELPESEGLSLYTEVHFEEGFDWWWGMSMLSDSNLKMIAEIGRSMSEYHNHVVRQLTESAWLGEFEGYRVMVANVSEPYVSDVGNTLRELDGVDFSLTFWVKKNGDWAWSMRSKTVDVSKIALKYGGGGHEKASGFTHPVGLMPKRL